jgi:predicted RNA-binding Zn-ribbon protein involved in translation (DUF1610 family)
VGYLPSDSVIHYCSLKRQAYYKISYLMVLARLSCMLRYMGGSTTGGAHLLWGSRPLSYFYNTGSKHLLLYSCIMYGLVSGDSKMACNCGSQTPRNWEVKPRPAPARTSSKGDCPQCGSKLLPTWKIWRCSKCSWAGFPPK